jgi:uncharacterized protein
MAQWNEPRPDQTGFGAAQGSLGGLDARTTFDEGLRRHMLSIYNYMTSGVLLSGIVAMLFQPTAEALRASGSMLIWLLILAPVAFVFFFSPKRATGTLQAMFWAFCVVMGLSLSVLITRFTGESVAVAFFSTAAAFAGLSLFGYTTKKSLSGWGSFLTMGVVGLIVAMLLNAFLFKSGAMGLAISVIGLLIFAGLTAYDTQRLKEEYAYLKGTDFAGKAVILGALTLYLDFINMFQFLLSLMGNRE